MDFFKVLAELYDLIGDRAIADRHRMLAGRYVRDWFGCYMAGGATEAGKIIRGYAGKKPDAGMAVFSTAALTKQAGSDDIHQASMTRPGCVVIPAAMILGRNLDKSCTEMLDAVITGYEVMIRIGEGMGSGPNAAMENTGSAAAGAYAAAAVASRLMNAGRDEFVRSMIIAGTLAPGAMPFTINNQSVESLRAGHAAQSGFRAAMLARGLYELPDAPAPVNDVWGNQFPESFAERILSDASSWRIGETSTKPYPSSRHTHAAIDAVLEIRHHLMENPFVGISSVKLTASDAAIKSGDNPSPSDSYAARLSLQYNICATLLKGPPALEHYEKGCLTEILNHPHMKKISIGSASPVNSGEMGHLGCRIDVVLDNGKTLTRAVDIPRGDPDNPLSDEELDEKVIAHLHYAGFTDEGARVLMKPFREITSTDAVPDCWWLRADDHQTFMN
ncbi:MAG: MmgE/PrpD family protein [Rhodothermaceae bacterium]|nr:MmgE/PrpD family protein [Rhodothermaceae bacterium]